jgi:hypothetical protein
MCLIDGKEAAERYGLSPIMLGSREYRLRHQIPFFALGRHIRFDVAEMEAWVESRRGHKGHEKKPLGPKPQGPPQAA